MVVSEKLALWIGLFGPPHILQCDNGTEFKDSVTGALTAAVGLAVNEIKLIGLLGAR